MSAEKQSSREPIADLDPRDLCISKHTTVLGVDITAKQEDMQRRMAGESVGSRLGEPVKVKAWRGESHLRQRCRKELAAWARRNLFEGASPG